MDNLTVFLIYAGMMGLIFALLADVDDVKGFFCSFIVGWAIVPALLFGIFCAVIIKVFNLKIRK